MAEIFLALQRGAEGFEKPVVLKRILPSLAADPKFVRMIVDEAHIASTLNHSNLVQVLDLGKTTDNQYFLVLEFVDGWSLEEVRRRARKARMKIPLPVALYVTGALCRGLDYVHTRTLDGKPLGIIHRDVSPQNVLISRAGDVKLADFGIAKAANKREKSATGVIKGKFAYMSPEQAVGQDLDARSDLFSVGTVLYVLTTGKKPFEGTTDLDVLMKVRKARYDKPSTIVKNFNEDVERFIVRALRSERSKRWQSADQMARRIAALSVKLGQPSGPGVLKRWLESLAAKDGVTPPEVTADPTAGTIELGTEDIELEEIADVAAARAEAATAEAATTDGPTRAAQPRSKRRSASAAAAAEASEAYEDVHISRGTRARVASASRSPSRTGRFVRWTLGVALRLVLLAALLGAAAYFARPYLPDWAAQPINSLLRQMNVQ